MKQEFKLERKAMRTLPESHPENHYLSKEMQAQYAIKISEEGYFEDAKQGILNGEYNFVLTCEEEPQLLCDRDLHHSSLANGKKALAVGTLRFDNGMLVVVTNNSGHYRPTDEEMLNVIKILYKISQGALYIYKSYCSSPYCSYPVSELIKTRVFSTVKPLKQDETINQRTGQRATINNYDTLENTQDIDRRYGRKLQSDMSTKYKGFIDSKGKSVETPLPSTSFIDTNKRKF